MAGRPVVGSLLELGGEKRRERRRKGERRKSVELERQKLLFKDQFSRNIQTLNGMQFET